MTDQTPDRRIAGLVPRPAANNDLSRLRSKNRRPAEDGMSTQPQASAAVQTGPAVPAAAPKGGEDGKARVSIYLDPIIRDHARATYKATAHLAGDRSWSEFVERAIAAETARREERYNKGQEYRITGDTRLSPGRPIT